MALPVAAIDVNRRRYLVQMDAAYSIDRVCEVSGLVLPKRAPHDHNLGRVRRLRSASKGVMQSLMPAAMKALFETAHAVRPGVANAAFRAPDWRKGHQPAFGPSDRESFAVETRNKATARQHRH